MSNANRNLANEVLTYKEDDVTANPAPLGLMGFGITTVLLNIHNIGVFGIGSMILAMGLFYGGIAQVIAGIMEWKKNNTFGTVAFTSYGLFWLSFAGIHILPALGMAEPANKTALAYYLFMWCLFTAVLYVATLKLDKATQVVFLLLTILFFLLGLADITGIKAIGQIAGYVGILTGLSAFYNAAAQILNEIYDQTVLPRG
jgi:succinate-acetate transporter protein